MENAFGDSAVVKTSNPSESQALLAQRQAANGHPDTSVQQGPETQKYHNPFASHDESGIWMKFEVRRRSANFYLDEYLQARMNLNNFPVSDVQSQSLGVYRRTVLYEEFIQEGCITDWTAVLPEHQETSGSRDFWRLKAARDNLLQDLRALCYLLESIAPSTATLFAKSCILPLFL
jgi:hypothetical protein